MLTEGLSTYTRKEKIHLASLLKERERRNSLKTSTVVGLVCPQKGLTHAIKKTKGVWSKTDQEPEVYLSAKMERVLTSNKRFIIVIGGRGSSKSVCVADICLIDARDNKSKTYCLREYQSSIKNSVHSLLKEEAKRLEFDGFETQHNSILYKNEACFEFAGLARNVDSIKSAHGFKRYWGEESQSITEESLTALTPTARKKPNKGLPRKKAEMTEESNVSMIFVANPGSSEDPFSKRFINPYKDHLDAHGYYEDNLHLIVMMNYVDNPWYEESGLEEERLWDYENRSRALYDHIWLGDNNDSVEDSLIMAEWFDACIDAHLKLGFEPKGAKIAAHDPSDTGPDSKGYVMRHGSVILDVQEKETGNVNEGCDWATGLALKHQVDYFTWDGDGMGAALAQQISATFQGKRTKVVMYRGSEGPDNPDAMHHTSLKSPVAGTKTNKETFKNKRAQYYSDLRERCYRTYRAVVHSEYHDPDTLISFSSEIQLLSKLRAEICRMPVKPNKNGLFELYTKPEMKSKFKISSPNLGDSAKMTLRYINLINENVDNFIPKPIKSMGVGR